MQENICLINLFPTQGINGGRLTEVLDAFTCELKLQPEKWGHNERVRQLYNEVEIPKLVIIAILM